MFDWAVSWSQWFLLNFLLFFKSLHGVSPLPLPAPVFPLLLFASALVLLLRSPPPALALGARTLYRIVCAPFAPVTFWDSFAADGLTSLVGPMTDLAYSACYFGCGEWIAAKGEQGVCQRSPAMREVRARGGRARRPAQRGAYGGWRGARCGWRSVGGRRWMARAAVAAARWQAGRRRAPPP